MEDWIHSRHDVDVKRAAKIKEELKKLKDYVDRRTKKIVEILDNIVGD